MDIKSLKQFLHLCESRHFAKTASMLHMSPSTLSRSIARLEQSLGQSLFVRDNRRVDLTLAGKKLLPVAQKIVQEWLELTTALDPYCNVLAGELRFFCSVTASYSYLPPLLQAFRLEYPKVSLKLTTGDPALAIDEVILGRCDMALAAKPLRLPDALAFHPIAEIPMVMLAPIQSTPWSEKLQIRPIDWGELPMILPREGAAREHIEQWLKRRGIKAEIYAEVAGHEAIVSMVALGTGVGIAPEVVLQSSPVQERVRRIEVERIEPLILGICALQSRLREPMMSALWRLGTSLG